ncbi:hypothetical protein [Pseudomonas oryziphila]|uniref:Uncharacterized protein n=1 Tax=Pseudomonas entomophila TaxID=312306 RepID=A0A3Q8U196_9PSED|nr:hypothetical protein [Pseudomonas oryziphila]AZL68800.1 hypothetical protein EJA05_14125 [Pseudomonas oryziphila]
MFARTAAIGLLMVPLVASAAQKTEYLIPENWEANKSTAATETSLDLTPKSFQSGMSKHLKEIPQCADAKLGKGELIKDGTVVYQTLKLNGAGLDIILDVNSKGKISNAKFTGPEGPQNDPQLRVMMCSTYAVMRTLQPQYETPEQAQRNMSHLWKSAVSKPFTKAFYFNTIKAQSVPFEMNVY